MDTILTGEHAGLAERNFPVPALAALTARQNVSELAQTYQGGSCVSIDAWFYEIGRHTNATDVNPVTQGCDLVDGVEGGTRKKTFDISRLDLATHVIKGPKCANASTVTEETAVGLLKCMADIRKKAQKKYYTLFDTNAQADQWGGDATFAASAAGGNRLRVDENKWDFELLLRMDSLAVNNLFPEEYLIIDGNNLYHNGELARYKRLNDNERDQGAVFGDARIFHDRRTLDAFIGAPSTFLVNPSNFIFHNEVEFPNVPTPSRANPNRVRYFVDDPVWRWNYDGQLRPVRYHVEMEYTCDSRNSRGAEVEKILMNVSLVGVLDIGPVGMNNPVDSAVAPTASITGAMAIRKEDAA
ncbi:hypothetical protein [Lewinella sp. W8]|uniref:hypothetical protein n=1 Tax=Lewinella sp. W8 TaxID=2528208 RepID=UPI0011ADB9C0|nr:hypothetical protein [Lewinella sp. W8]